MEEKLIINNKYIKIADKGDGATSKVYLCEDKDTKKKYAVKVLEKITPSFQNEIEILRRVSLLKNEYITNLVDYGQGTVIDGSGKEETKQYIVLEYASKGDLYKYILNSKKGFEEKYAKFIFTKILKGVQAIHDAGICHRDLKIQNILVDEFFNPKICDFGYSGDLKGKDGSGLLDVYCGTPNYAAPELFLHQRYNGVKVDIFSLGVVLLNLVTGKKGFLTAEKTDDYYKYIMAKKYKSYWELVKGKMKKISKPLKNLYLKMISFEPKDRPSINDILLKDPWMKEIRKLKENDYKKLEKEVYEEFKKIEDTINNKEINVISNKGQSSSNNRNMEEDEKEYFTNESGLKVIVKSETNLNNYSNYIKINGNINPINLMNSIANKIKSKLEDKCSIKASDENVEFNVIFENNEEDKEVGKDEEKEEKNKEVKEEGKDEVKEEEEENLCETENDKDLEEELEKIGLKNDENIDNEIEIEMKESIIGVNLFKSERGGYYLCFLKKGGEIEDYYKNLEQCKKIIIQTI